MKQHLLSHAARAALIACGLGCGMFTTAPAMAQATPAADSSSGPEIVVVAQIVADRRLPGDESTPLRRGYVGTRDDISDDTCMPAMAGFDEKVVLLLAIAAHLGIRHAETFGANPRRFRQHFQYVALAKSKAAKVGHRSLLAQKFADMCSVFTHRGIT